MTNEQKKEKSRWLLLLLFAVGGAIGGAFLCRMPRGSTLHSESFLFGCGWRRSCVGCYLLQLAFYSFAFLSFFSRLCPGCCMTLAFLRALLSGYLAFALFALRGEGSAGVLRYLLWVLAEGEILTLFLCYMRRGMFLCDRRPSPGRMFAEGGGILLYCLGITALTVFLRALLC